MKRALYICIFLFVIQSVHACTNYYYTLDSEGHFHRQDGGMTHFNINFNKEKIVSKLLQLDKKLSKEKDYKILSDYALGLMKLGKIKESIEILATLYYHHPNEYRLASNLGTAYELSGELDSALKYIKRGLELNPNDHEGSEWIHVKVLEAKQQIQKNLDYLKKKTVLQLTESQKKDTKVREQIDIQVRERFPFSPGPDEIMASLMEDLGDTYKETYSIEYAKAFYDIAKIYFGSESTTLDSKMADVKKLSEKYENKKVPAQQTEGDHGKLVGVFYKHLLDDNDKQKYQVNWSTITTNVDTLLAKVNLQKLVLSNKTPSAEDSLKFIKDGIANENIVKKDVPVDMPKSRKWVFLVISGLIVVAFASYLFVKRGK